MKKLFFLSYFGFCVVCYSQNGPGGVESNSGTDNLILWLTTSDFQEQGYQLGDAVTNWPDLSGNGADPTTTGARPLFVPNSINGWPSVVFNRTQSHFLEGQLPGTIAAPISIIAVARFNEAVQTSGTGQYIVGIGSGGDAGNQVSISRQASDATPIHAYYSFTGVNRSLGPTVGTDWQIFTALHNTSAPLHSFYLNNAAQTVSNDYTASFAPLSNFYNIGRNRSGFATSFLEGEIAELIVVNRLLSDAERNCIANYLSSKYDLPISNDLFTYDNAVLGNYDRDIAGVGTEANGAQLVSASKGLTISINSGFSNGEYVFIGHRNTINTVNTYDVSEAGNSLQGRWARVWAVDVTDDISGNNTIDLSFDFSESGIGGFPGSAANYRLIRSLGEGLGWQVVSSAATLSGDIVSFQNINVADGEYTLATTDLVASALSSQLVSFGDGPAAIGNTNGSDGLLVWLDASQITGVTNGAALATWEDLTTNNHDASQGVVANQPTFLENQFNGLPAVVFDQEDEEFLTGSFGNLDAPATIIAVGSFNQLNQPVGDADYIFDVGEGVPAFNQPGVRASISRRWPDDAIPRADRYYSFGGDGLYYGPQITGNQLHVFSSTYQSASPYHQLFYDGARAESAPGTTSLNSNGDYRLGRLVDQANFFLEGAVAELIVYDAALNSAQIRILQASLAAKWDIALSQDLYWGDEPGTANYDLDVAGVGRAIDGDVVIGESGGLRIEMGNGAGLESFLLFGHGVGNNSVNSTDVNDNIYERADRVWYVSITGSFSNQNDLIFDFSNMGLTATPANPSNYVLISRSGLTGNWAIGPTASSITGDAVTFSDVTLTSNTYYTIASINLIPLPVTLTDFSVALLEEDNKPVVVARWQTASEINNDFFSVERSLNGSDWTILDTVKGAGTTSLARTYSFTDYHPLVGVSYYRLKQTDLDSTNSYPGGIQKIYLERDSHSISIYPNPAKKSVSFSNHFSGSAHYLIKNSIGQTLQRGVVDTSANTVDFDLYPGMYYISITSNSGTVTKPFVVAPDR